MVCSGCNNETLLVAGCIVETIPDHRVFRVHNRDHSKVRCNDCSCLVGKLHHVGCSYEECPICGDLMQTCDCSYKKS